MNNQSFVASAFRRAYGVNLEAAPVEAFVFAQLMVSELNRRDGVITAITEGNALPALWGFLGTLSDDLEKMARDARSLVGPK